MARIYRDSSVLNQYGSPSLNSNTIANRPAFGQVGRLFVDTTNNVIYRDTGSSWVLVGGAGSTPNLQAVTGVGNTSSNGIFLGLTGSLTAGLIFEVSGYTRMQQTVASASNLGSSNIKQFTFQTSGTTVATGNPSPDLSQLFVDIQVAQTVGGAGNLQIGAGLFENVLSGTDNLLLTITQTVGLSALSPIISYQRYINNSDSRISHTAGLVINGLQQTGAGVLQVTNNYQLLINSSQQFASTSIVSNRWGIYQAGANDYNYFASKILINTLTSNGALLKIGDIYDNQSEILQSSGNIGLCNTIANTKCLINFYNNQLNTGSGYGLQFFYNQSIQTGGITQEWLTSSRFGLIFKNYPTSLQEAMRVSEFNNLLIGTTTDTTRKLVVNGNVEILTTTATGVHTPTSQHLPIYVNGVQYYLQLLN